MIAIPATRRVILGALERFTVGALVVELPDGTRRRFGDAAVADPRTLTIVRDAFFAKLARRGRIGFGEAYLDGDWTTDDLPGVLTVLARSVEQAREREPLRSFLRVASRRPHVALPRSRARAERDVHHHYDLGNRFYALFLDPSLTYSCALFERPGQSLTDAQQAKYRRIADRLSIGADDRVLEIGCGWGGFALHAAAERGARVTAVTISREQHDEADRRVRAAGLEDRVEVVYRDFRDVRGTYSKIVSIEMLEAIGERQFGPYFAAIDRLLAPGGRALVQTIAVPDDRYAAYRRTRDFIRAHVFPGGHLPSLAVLDQAVHRTALRIDSVADIGPHYAPTLRTWRTAFLDHLAEVRALGFDHRFLRLWDFYLAFCEVGFRERLLLDLQLELAR